MMHLQRATKSDVRLNDGGGQNAGHYGRFSDEECLLTKPIFSHGAFNIHCVICMFLPWTRQTENITSVEGSIKVMVHNT